MGILHKPFKSLRILKPRIGIIEVYSQANLMLACPGLETEAAANFSASSLDFPEFMY